MVRSASICFALRPSPAPRRGREMGNGSIALSMEEAVSLHRTLFLNLPKWKADPRGASLLAFQVSRADVRALVLSLSLSPSLPPSLTRACVRRLTRFHPPMRAVQDLPTQFTDEQMAAMVLFPRTERGAPEDRCGGAQFLPCVRSRMAST